MEENESLEHKLPTVENPTATSPEESTGALQMEQPSSSVGVSQGGTTTTQAQVSNSPTSPTPQSSVATGYVATSGISAEDVDLIEKAWVQKAKAIVQSTHGDPFNQNKELNKVKAEYIKQRFDKDIKVVE